MKYAILAAGDGSRLVQEGETRPKPLIRVGGETLIDRLLRVFMTNDATEIAVICNPQMTAVAAYLESVRLAGQIPLRYMIRSTPSSMHSLCYSRYHLSGTGVCSLCTGFSPDDCRRPDGSDGLYRR